MSQQTEYQGNRYSFPDITAEGETTQLYGSVPFVLPKGVLQSLNWKASQDAGIVQGNQIGMMGRTSGYGVGTGDMGLLMAEARDWVKKITSNGFFPLMSVYFNLRISYSVNGIDSILDSLSGIKILETGTDNSKGNDATVSTFSLSISKVSADGIAMFGDPTS